MAFRDIFNKRDSLYAAATSAVPAVPDTTHSLPHGILSQTLPLEAVIFPDLDVSAYPVTVAEAIQVPAIWRAIALYSSISSRFVLDSEDNSTAWLSESKGYATPQLRIAETIQSLIFHGNAMWKLERDSFGSIVFAEHIDKARWTSDKGVVKIDDVPVSEDNFIFFKSLLPTGLLDAGRNSIRQYTSISKTVSNRVQHPSPVTLVKETAESSATEDEISEAMDQLRESLTSGRGGMPYIPYGIDVLPYGAGDNANEIMVAARNQCRIDLANFLNINASLLEGAVDGSSETYSSTLMQASELLELSIKAWTEPIADRLTGALGVKVSFDYSSFDTNPNNTDKGTVPEPINEVTE